MIGRVSVKAHRINAIIDSHPGWEAAKLASEYYRLYKEKVTREYAYQVRKKRGLLPASRQQTNGNGAHQPPVVDLPVVERLDPADPIGLPKEEPKRQGLTPDVVAAGFTYVGEVSHLADRVGGLAELRKVIDWMITVTK